MEMQLQLLNKEDIYKDLAHRGIWFEVTEHKAVYNMDDLVDVEQPYPEADAKTSLYGMTKRKITT